MKKVFVAIIFFIVAACAAPSRFKPSAAELPQMQAKVPDITYDQAQQGYILYVNHCGACHRIHNPAEFSKEQWPKILSKMYVKAKMKDGNEMLLIRNYLYAKSK